MTYSRIAGGLILSAAMVAAPAAAQKFPEKPIRIIVPWAPGGNIDITARTVAPGLSEVLGVAVLVDNRGGASGQIGVDLTVKAPPDGYTLVMGSTGNISGAPAIFPKLPYDPIRDLAPVSLVSIVPIIIVVHPSLRARNMQELIALAKQAPGRMTMGSPGAGSTNHMAGEMFQLATGTKITHVPYKGSGPALIDLMGGQIDLLFDQLTSSIGFLKSGKLRAIGIASSTRSAQVPDIPTLAEQGCKGCEASTFAGLMGPANMPKAVVDRLAEATARVVRSKPVQERFAALGAEARATTPEEFAQLIREDVVRWTRVVKEANIKIE